MITAGTISQPISQPRTPDRSSLASCRSGNLLCFGRQRRILGFCSARASQRQLAKRCNGPAPRHAFWYSERRSARCRQLNVDPLRRLRRATIEHPWDDRLIEQLNAAGVRHQRLTREDHRRRESEWRKVYGHVFRSGLRHRHGAKAVHEYLNTPATHWVLVPFLSNVPGTPMHVLAQRLSAFDCEGPLLELGEFSDIEFFVSPPDLAWTFVRTHEDFALGGPYFVRAEWVIVPGASGET